MKVADLNLPKYIPVTMAARWTGLPIDHLRAMADRGEFARRHFTNKDGRQRDFFEVTALREALASLPGEPERLKAEREFADWQSSGRRVGRRRPAGQDSRRGSSAASG